MIKIHVGLHVKYPFFLLDFNETLILSKDFRKMKLEFSRRIFEKYSNTSYHKNPF